MPPVIALRPGFRWFAPPLAVLGLTVLYAGAIGTGFLNDDYLFLEQARSRPLVESLTHLGPLGNYFRPLSRQLYFAALTPIGGGQPLVFHLVNYGVFLAALVLLVDLLLAFVPPVAAMAGALYFALLPLQHLALTWISCSQDLLALALALASFALYRRGWVWPAALTYLCAVASKESALPLPLALLAWDAGGAGVPARQRVTRLAPFAVVAIGWGALSVAMRLEHPAAAAFLRFSPGQFAAGYAHMLQGLIGLDAPDQMLDALMRRGPALAPLLLLGAPAFWIGPAMRVRRDAEDGPRRMADRDPDRASTPGADREPRGWRPATSRVTARFAALWLASFGLVLGPVAHTWSGYYAMLAAVGGALAVGLACRRLDRWSWLGLSAALLWWHAAGTGVRTFAIEDRPWGWTSHLTSYYFERAATLTRTLSLQLKALEPAPAPGTRFFFATLPPWAGFQMGNGALVRALYRDPSLESHFYSQFSDSSAGDRPCRFFYWDGEQLRWLYPGTDNPFFQVGTDLLLLERPAGASHAFRRGLAAGGDRMDLLYWLGWTELWRGRRSAAEAAWRAFGAHDDSLLWSAHLRQAHDALVAGDTLESRRHLAAAIEFGIGRPEAHAVLGELLMARQPKYAMLELKAAVFLKPDDWLARRELALGLTAARLDEPARAEIEALKRSYPEWRGDRALVGADSTLRLRRGSGAPRASGVVGP